VEQAASVQPLEHLIQFGSFLGVEHDYRSDPEAAGPRAPALDALSEHRRQGAVGRALEELAQLRGRATRLDTAGERRPRERVLGRRPPPFEAEIRLESPEGLEVGLSPADDSALVG
jgi:hypothetical protein